MASTSSGAGDESVLLHARTIAGSYHIPLLLSTSTVGQSDTRPVTIVTGLVLFDGEMSSLRFGEETLDEDGEGVGGTLFGGDSEVGRGRAKPFCLEEEERGLYLPM